MPPSQGRADEAFLPAWASWIATGIGGACRRALASVSPNAFSVSSSYSPRQPSVIRPPALTAVASIVNIPAPDRSICPQWIRCQSVAQPSSAEYWHIGDTTMRLASARPRSAMGSNRCMRRSAENGDLAGHPRGFATEAVRDLLPP